MKYDFFCKCGSEVKPEGKGRSFKVKCSKCGEKTTTKRGLRALKNLWEYNGGKTKAQSKYVPRPRTPFHDFLERVETETRTRLANEHHATIADVSLISDENLDAFSKIEVTDLENGTRQVKIGPKKILLVTKSGEIRSKNSKEQYGTLKTIDEWDWGGFWPVPRDEIWKNRNAPVNQTPAMRGKRNIFK